uniref:Beta-hexosaminidase n=1 Tax=Spodoptera frugiperda TaxID=7108 RepID=Q2Q1D2_SPOFR|nr:beta-N-acetylglucosaminidase 2 [Spodoptera frugiperda]
MLRHVILLFAVVYLTESLSIVNPGPQYPPTKGSIWPRPHQQTQTDSYYKLNPSTFVITEKGKTCDILKDAIDRYMKVLRNTYLIVEKYSRKLSRHGSDADNFDDNFKGTLQELQINLSAPCETYPHLDMDEKYSLDVAKVSVLNSDSIWGVLRGLESFVQLFYMADGYKNVLINATQIQDFPKYTHRGLLVDTSRHYITVPTLLKTLDAMEMNKMNVLHWHIVDDQSFPYKSDMFPQLSDAAYDPTMVYTAVDITQIVSYARHRGIRVLPEFDVPGHTSSWGVAYPNILTKCYSLGRELGLGPMDPTKNITYKLIGDLIREVQDRFPDKYFHVGGDEVELDCWISNSEIRDFMKDHNMTDASELHSYFMANVIPLLGDRSKPIVWQEVFDEGVSLPSGTIVQVWKNTEAREMQNILSGGYKVIYSSSWYLDHINGGGDWAKYYGVDPREIVKGSVPEDKEVDILGGEACMWGEVVDDTNIISRVWPRASAVAEALWSGHKYETMPYLRHWYQFREDSAHVVSSRLEEHACRMNRRGIEAQPPNGPGFCVTGNYF